MGVWVLATAAAPATALVTSRCCGPTRAAWLIPWPPDTEPRGKATRRTESGQLILAALAITWYLETGLFGEFFDRTS
jgi:hypothetical protein